MKHFDFQKTFSYILKNNYLVISVKKIKSKSNNTDIKQLKIFVSSSLKKKRKTVDHILTAHLFSILL